jgi:DNA-binding protein H-NS
MASYQSLMDKISVLQKQASTLRETEKKRVVAEIRKLIDQYDVQPVELFSNVKPRVGRPASASASIPAPAKGRQVRQIKKPSKPPKFRDPATGKTWNGHGKTPLWLVGVSDRSAYLIDAQAGAASAGNAVKPQKAKPAAGRKPKAAKGTIRRGVKRETAPKADESANSPEVS